MRAFSSAASIAQASSTAPTRKYSNGAAFMTVCGAFNQNMTWLEFLWCDFNRHKLGGVHPHPPGLRRRLSSISPGARLSGLRIYGIAPPRAFRALWMANELGLDYEHLPIEIGAAGARSPEFLAINPNGRL